MMPEIGGALRIMGKVVCDAGEQSIGSEIVPFAAREAMFARKEVDRATDTAGTGDTYYEYHDWQSGSGQDDWSYRVRPWNKGRDEWKGHHQGTQKAEAQATVALIRATKVAAT